VKKTEVSSTEALISERQSVNIYFYQLQNISAYRRSSQSKVTTQAGTTTSLASATILAETESREDKVQCLEEAVGAVESESRPIERLF